MLAKMKYLVTISISFSKLKQYKNTNIANFVHYGETRLQKCLFIPVEIVQSDAHDKEPQSTMKPLQLNTLYTLLLCFRPLYELRIFSTEFIRIECMANFDHILKTIYQAIKWCHFSQEHLSMYKSIDLNKFQNICISKRVYFRHVFAYFFI